MSQFSKEEIDSITKTMKTVSDSQKNDEKKRLFDRVQILFNVNPNPEHFQLFGKVAATQRNYFNRNTNTQSYQLLTKEIGDALQSKLSKRGFDSLTDAEKKVAEAEAAAAEKAEAEKAEAEKAEAEKAEAEKAEAEKAAIIIQKIERGRRGRKAAAVEAARVEVEKKIKILESLSPREITVEKKKNRY